MTKEDAYEKQRRELIAVTHENRKLKAQVAGFDRETYISAEKAAHLKQISHLTWENTRLKNERDQYKAYWERQVKVAENFRVCDLDSKSELRDVTEERDFYKNKCAELESRIDVILGNSGEESRKLHAQINALTNALLKEKSKADNDGTNSGTPTSQTPINKKKRIPNSREKSTRKRGAQVGHQKHKLLPFTDTEVTETEDHCLDFCPDCHSGRLALLEKREKDVLDYEVVLRKKRNCFWIYECLDCGHTVHSPIPLHLKEPVQYGPNLQALGLALQNVGFVSISRCKKLMDGILGNGICLSEGFLCKLQKRAAKALSDFSEAVRIACIRSRILHWDDTVIFVNTARACMRFYGNERLALFVAHRKKDREGIDSDGILGALGQDTTVIHDHVTMNYNPDFHFTNAECVQHLMRELENVSEISGHSWAGKLKELIAATIHRRNLLSAAGASAFSCGERYDFLDAVDALLKQAEEEHQEAAGTYYEEDEKKLITRLKKYKDSYFLWVKDFSVAPTNNLAERSLRGQKVKQKVSGQFLSVETAGYFAAIRTYLETCYRNGVDSMDALVRLTSGNPYTLNEVLGEA